MAQGSRAKGDRARKPPLIVVWAARLSLYFVAQGGILLLSYAYYGFGTDPHSFPVGFRVDPVLAAVHLAWGIAGTYIGFYRPRYALGFLLAFAVFFTALALLGIFTSQHFGMLLDPRVNFWHGLAALGAGAIGLYGLYRH